MANVTVVVAKVARRQEHALLIRADGCINGIPIAVHDAARTSLIGVLTTRLM